MNKTKDKSFNLNLIAIIFAFTLGLTLGQIDFKAILEPSGVYKSREVTSALSVEVPIKAANAYTPATDTEQNTSVNKGSALINKGTQEDEPVYRTPSGQRYHYDIFCAGSSYIESTIEEATALGLTPCKKCVGE